MAFFGLSFDLAQPSAAFLKAILCSMFGFAFLTLAISAFMKRLYADGARGVFSFSAAQTDTDVAGGTIRTAETCVQRQGRAPESLRRAGRAEDRMRWLRDRPMTRFVATMPQESEVPHGPIEAFTVRARVRGRDELSQREKRATGQVA